MSWSITPIERQPVNDALAALAGNTVPKPIVDYITAGIDGLVAKHGETVLVSISGQGHLCDVESKDSFGTTSAKLEVSGEAAAVEQPAAAAAEPTHEGLLAEALGYAEDKLREALETLGLSLEPKA